MQAEASLPLKMKELTYATLNNVLQLPNRSIRSGVSRGIVRGSIMGNCFKTTKMEGRSDQPIEKRTKPKVLCLHGWRTNGEILGMQMAALQSNTTMDCVFIDAPFPGRGDPDSGIGLFYPDRSYFEWFYKIEKTNVDVATASNLKASDIYENLEESMKFLKKHIESKGPYDGLLGFSQGASMVTRLAKIQEETTLVSSKSSFKFVILIGGIPPQVCVYYTEASCGYQSCICLTTLLRHSSTGNGEQY